MTLCRELALEETLDLSQDRLSDEQMNFQFSMTGNQSPAWKLFETLRREVKITEFYQDDISAAWRYWNTYIPQLTSLLTVYPEGHSLTCNQQKT